MIETWLLVVSAFVQIALLVWIGLVLARIRHKASLLLDDPEASVVEGEPAAQDDEPPPESPRVEYLPAPDLDATPPAPPLTGSARSRAARRPL